MPKCEAQTRQQIIEFCSNPDLVNYVCLLLRSGIYAWMTEIEYTKFKPDTPANDGFHLFQCKWPEDDPVPAFTMVIVSFDKSGQEFAESILWKNGLKKCPSDMVAISIGPQGSEKFFLTGPNVFQLENHSRGAKNVVYHNDPKLTEAAFEHEKAQVKVFHDEHEAWLKTPEGKASYEAYWAGKPEGYCK